MNTDVSTDLLNRYAAIYIRQSTLYQHEHNIGSAERQAALAEKAVSLGWTPERVLVFHDEGRSAATPDNRPDFDRLIQMIDRKQVGIVLVVSGTRVSRNRIEWAKFLDACAYSGTLISINGRTYDHNNISDHRRLEQLSSKANTHSEIRKRKLSNGRYYKLKYGEMRLLLPVGLEYNAQGEVVKSEHAEVRSVVALVFQLFCEIGSGYGVVKELKRRGVRVPRPGKRRGDPVRWEKPTTGSITLFLRNPAYAGTTAYYRRTLHPTRPGSGLRDQLVRHSDPAAWRICRLSTHEGYIDWNTYLANIAKLEANRVGGIDAQPRTGAALLHRLLFCGICGRSMLVMNGQKDDGSVNYACKAGLHEAVGSGCQFVIGPPVEEAIISALQEVLSPAEQVVAERLEHARRLASQQASLDYAQITRDLKRHVDVADAALQQAICTQLALDRLDPFARAWEQAIERLEAHLAVSPPPEPTPDDGAASIVSLRELWFSQGLNNVQRKLIVRSLIARIRILKDIERRTVWLHIDWHGGAHTTLLLGDEDYRFKRETPDSVYDVVRAMWPTHRPKSIAQHLNDAGQRTSRGRVFTGSGIRRIAHLSGLSNVKRVLASDISIQDLPVDHYTLDDAARLLGIEPRLLRKLFPKADLGLGTPHRYLAFCVHIPQAAIPELQTLMAESGNDRPSQATLDTYAAERMTDDQWAPIDRFLRKTTPSGKRMTPPARARASIDALVWKVKHNVKWTHVPLARSDLKYARDLIRAWEDDGRLPTLVEMLRLRPVDTSEPTTLATRLFHRRFATLESAVREILKRHQH